jgi:hypothetical protein
MLREPRCFCATETPVLILCQIKSVHLVPQFLRPSLMLIYHRKKQKCYTHVFTCTLRFWSVMCTTSLHLSSATYIACAAANCSRGWTSLTYSWRSSFIHWVTLLASTHTCNRKQQKGSVKKGMMVLCRPEWDKVAEWQNPRAVFFFNLRSCF